jgi:hypothetical protein
MPHSVTSSHCEKICLYQLASLCEIHVDTEHELLDRVEMELGLPNSRGGHVSDKDAEKRRREEELEEKERRRYAEMERLKRVLAGVAMRRWIHRTIGQAWAKWSDEVRKKRVCGKMVKRWQHRKIFRAWQAWQWMLSNKRRLRSVLSRQVVIKEKAPVHTNVVIR